MKKVFFIALLFVIVSGLFGLLQAENNKGDKMEFQTEIFSQFAEKWALLTAGTKDSFNSMTIGWGGMGTLWGKPVITVYVKPTRYTYKFMNDSDYFTVSFYPEENRKALAIMGSKSGRDCDKVKKSGLTPKFLEKSVTYEEAETTFLCKKIYYDDMIMERFPAESMKYYDKTRNNGLEYSFHRMYIGEVVDIIKK